MAVNSKSVDIQGWDDLILGFDRLEAYATKTVLEDATHDAAMLVVNAARQLAPRKTGQLERAIRARKGKSHKGSVCYLASLSKKWFQGEEYYGAFQEFGWQTGSRKSKNRSHVRGEHFMQYAYEEHAQEALDLMIVRIQEGIRSELK